MWLLETDIYFTIYTLFYKKSNSKMPFFAITLADYRFLSYFIDSMKIKQTLVIIALLIGFSAIFICQPVFADCGGTETSVIDCPQGNNTDIKSSGVWGILLFIINILTAGVGVLAVGGVVYGSILYASAGGSVEQVKKAISTIVNVVIGIIAYALMFSFLNFIIPGGVFSGSSSSSSNSSNTNTNSSNSDGPSGGGNTDPGASATGGN